VFHGNARVSEKGRARIEVGEDGPRHRLFCIFSNQVRPYPALLPAAERRKKVNLYLRSKRFAAESRAEIAAAAVPRDRECS